MSQPFGWFDCKVLAMHKLKTWSMQAFLVQTSVLLVSTMTCAGRILTRFTTKLIGSPLSKSQHRSRALTVTIDTVFEWKK